MKELFKQLQIFLEENLSPNRINNEPYPIHMFSLPEAKLCASYNEALDMYYEQFLSGEEIQQKETTTKKKKWEDMIEQQEKQKSQVEKAIEENKIKAEYIYNHYIDIKEILDLWKEKKYDEIKKKGVEVEGKNLLLEMQ